MKRVIKIYIFAVLCAMLCLIEGCGKEKEESLLVTEKQLINTVYREEHLNLGVEYEKVTVKNDTIYGTYKTEDGYVVIYQDKFSGNVKKQISLNDDINVLGIQVDSEENVYLVTERGGAYKFCKIEESGQYSELVELDISQNEKIIKEELKGVFVSDKGYYYSWWSAGMPAKELLEEYEQNEKVYVYADLIYVMNEKFEVVHIEKIPMYNGSRLLDLQLGQNGEIFLFLKEAEKIGVKELSLDATSEKQDKIYLEKSNSLNIPNLFAVTNTGILYCQENILYEYDFDKQGQVELLNLNTYGVLPEEVMFIGKSEENIEILDTYKERRISEYTTLTKGESTKQILTLAVMEQCFQIFEDQSVRMIIIADFETAQPFTFDQ